MSTKQNPRQPPILLSVPLPNTVRSLRELSWGDHLNFYSSLQIFLKTVTFIKTDIRRQPAFAQYILQMRKLIPALHSKQSKTNKELDTFETVEWLLPLFCFIRISSFASRFGTSGIFHSFIDRPFIEVANLIEYNTPRGCTQPIAISACVSQHSAAVSFNYTLSYETAYVLSQRRVSRASGRPVVADERSAW